ncbi:MAG: PIN domain-containing protein [Oscillospiraceae bacterium]|nr:PIN domain-containing protein [Oscillospiraceae bacterium]
MRKKKIYLDTSVVSYLLQEDSPKEMAETIEFWEILKIGKYDVYISDVVVDELEKCAEPKRTELFTLLSEISYTNTAIEGNTEIKALEAEINRLGILPPRSDNDRLHIAAAVYRECNIIVSWNFKHMVNVKTIDGVRIVCVANNISPIDIYTPAVLLERSILDE